MGMLLSSLCLSRRDRRGSKAGLCSPTCSGEGCRLPWRGPREGPSIQLGHIVPKLILGWSSWMLGPSLGLGSCAGRQDVCYPSTAPSLSLPITLPLPDSQAHSRSPSKDQRAATLHVTRIQLP